MTPREVRQLDLLIAVANAATDYQAAHAHAVMQIRDVDAHARYVTTSELLARALEALATHATQA